MQSEMDPVMEVALWQHRQQIRGRIEARCEAVLSTKKKQKKRQQMYVEKARVQPPTPINLVSESGSESDDSDTTMAYPDADTNDLLAAALARWTAEPDVPEQSQNACTSRVQKYPVVPMTVKKL